MGCFESKPDDKREPTQVRGCTDVCWLCIYIVFWLLMLTIAVFSFVYGNPLKIINGYDSFGNTCGVENNERFSTYPLSGMNTVDKPFLFFLDIKELKKSLKLCVKECPSSNITNQNELYRYYEDHKTQYCRYDFNMSLLSTSNSRDMKYFDFLGPCPTLPVYESTSVLHRCIPLGKAAPGGQVRSIYKIFNSWGLAQQLLKDLYKTWPVILLVCVMSLLLSIIVIAMLHWLTQLISWIICVVVAVASIAITVLLWMTYYRANKGLVDGESLSLLESVVKNNTALYGLAIIASIITIIVFIAIYLVRPKLRGLAALFEEASKCMLAMPGLSGPPVLAVIAIAIFLTFWVAVVICLATANYPGVNPLITIQNNGSDGIDLKERTIQTNLLKNASDLQPNYKSFRLVEYVEASWLHHMLWIYFIGLIWTCEFIFACQQLALAGAVAFWYFRKPTDTPVIQSISKLVKYHLGSVAKGSFLITIFKIPRLILTYLYAKLKKNEANGCAGCCLKSCICCFWSLEKFIRFLNHNAYTVIAIESINFCPAAGIAWNALMSNALQVATINGIGDFILFLGKLAVAAICGLISLLMLRDNPEVGFYAAPVILTVVFSFFIAHIVLSLYEIVVDTLFLCVCEDRTINQNGGRWRESKLATLLGEEPVQEAEMQTVELTPINKQPFSVNA